MFSQRLGQVVMHEYEICQEQMRHSTGGGALVVEL